MDNASADEVRGNGQTEPAVFVGWRCLVLAVPVWSMLFTGVYEPKWSVLFLHEIVCSLHHLESLKRIKCIIYLFPNSSPSKLPTVCLYSPDKLVLQNSETALTVMMLTLLSSSSPQHLLFSFLHGSFHHNWISYVSWVAELSG